MPSRSGSSACTSCSPWRSMEIGLLIVEKLRSDHRADTGGTVAVAMVTLVAVMVLGQLPAPQSAAGSRHVIGRIRLAGHQATDSSFVPDWVTWNYSGYESPGKARGKEYFALVDEMEKIGADPRYGCGRAMWQYEPELDQMGTPDALMLLPYWTHGCIGSEEGLYYESSATTPYHFLDAAELSEQPSNPVRGLDYPATRRGRGCRAPSDARGQVLHGGDARHRGPGRRRPEPLADRHGRSVPRDLHHGEHVEREAEDLEDLRGPRLAAGDSVDQPAGCHQRDPVPQPAIVAHCRRRRGTSTRADGMSRGGVRPQELGAGVRYRKPPCPARRCLRSRSPTLKTGNGVHLLQRRPDRCPVLVKMSYFPNWQVSGASDIYRVTPNLMVVVPTSNHVTLTLRLHPGRLDRFPYQPAWSWRSGGALAPAVRSPTAAHGGPGRPDLVGQRLRQGDGKVAGPMDRFSSSARHRCSRRTTSVVPSPIR